MEMYPRVSMVVSCCHIGLGLPWLVRTEAGLDWDVGVREEHCLQSLVHWFQVSSVCSPT